MGRQVMNLVLLFVLGLTVLISPGATMANSPPATAREKPPGMGDEQRDIVRAATDTPSGNKTSEPFTSDGIVSSSAASRNFTYTYNARNQLQYLYENGVLKMEFIYDNNGNLIRKKVYKS